MPLTLDFSLLESFVKHAVEEYTGQCVAHVAAAPLYLVPASPRCPVLALLTTCVGAYPGCGVAQACGYCLA